MTTRHLTVSNTVSDPSYIRFPKPGFRCSLTGLSRSTLYQLVLPSEANGHRPPVRSAVIKNRGAVRGIRLINVPSLLAHLDQLTEHAADLNSQLSATKGAAGTHAVFGNTSIRQ